MFPRRISRARSRISANGYSAPTRLRPAAQLPAAALRLPLSSSSARASTVRSRRVVVVSG